MVVKPKITDDSSADIRFDKVDRAIHKIHDILYDKELNLLEIDLIVYTMWTNTQKDKIVQLAMADITRHLTKKNAELDKPVKEKSPPGVG